MGLLSKSRVPISHYANELSSGPKVPRPEGSPARRQDARQGRPDSSRTGPRHGRRARRHPPLRARHEGASLRLSRPQPVAFSRAAAPTGRGSLCFVRCLAPAAVRPAGSSRRLASWLPRVAGCRKNRGAQGRGGGSPERRVVNRCTCRANGRRSRSHAVAEAMRAELQGRAAQRFQL